MTVPRLLAAAVIAVVFYFIGTRTGRDHYKHIRLGARQAWNHPAAKKDRARLQKLASKSAKKVTKTFNR